MYRVLRGNLYKEMEPLIPKLLRLQEYGFLTHSSQPFQTAEPSKQAGWWVDSLQRPYVSFAISTNDRMPSRAVQRLCRELLAHPQIATLITQRGRPMRTNLQYDHEFVTVSTAALTIEELPLEPMKPRSSFRGVIALSPVIGALMRSIVRNA